jgi:hypothetical protein
MLINGILSGPGPSARYIGDRTFMTNRSLIHYKIQTLSFSSIQAWIKQVHAYIFIKTLFHFSHMSIFSGCAVIKIE